MYLLYVSSRARPISQKWIFNNLVMGGRYIKIESTSDFLTEYDDFLMTYVYASNIKTQNDGMYGARQHVVFETRHP